MPAKPARLGGLLVLILLVALARPGAAQQADGPEASPAAVVAKVNDSLLGAMRGGQALAFQGRYDRLAPVFRAAFDFPFMARVAVGRYWRDLQDGQRKRLAEAFADMSVATYAARFDGYDGQHFEIGETVDQPRGGALVRNRLIDGTGKAVAIDYLLRAFDGRWRIVDVFLDGAISELATKRSEYTAVLDHDGFDGLLAKISAKTAALAGK